MRTVIATGIDLDRVYEALQKARALPDRESTEHHSVLWVLRRQIDAMLPYASLRREQLPGNDAELIARLDQVVKAAKALGAARRSEFLASAQARRQEYIDLATQLLEYTEDALDRDREECRPW
ncbi:hypothetical protein AB0451_37985 [Streptomyces sp. NPDC052000]|uniref:hypothetical protein n=1 Tax=Streptomyces sp. NPDC052000 TaxID=3155676 RepID=UPI00344FBBC8